jgi:ATP-dependent Clp protease ATP-binding subunit ClpB
LQVLDDGRLTDGQGRTVDFRNTIIVLTSNIGSEYLAKAKDGEIDKSLRDAIMNEVRKAFRPEFLNRLDEIIFFKRLSAENMHAIAAIQIARLAQRLTDRHIKLDLDKSALDWLAEAGYDPAYGARPLKRIIQRELQNRLANKLLAGEIKDGSKVKIQGWQGGLKIG